MAGKIFFFGFCIGRLMSRCNIFFLGKLNYIYCLYRIIKIKNIFRKIKICVSPARHCGRNISILYVVLGG